MPTRIFIWDTVNDCVLQENDETGATLVTYTHEPGPFGPLVSQERSGKTSYHHFDALGSTRLLTDDNQDITDTYLADACGNEVATTGTTENVYRWGGRWGYEYSTSTGHYYIRERIYEPIIARWTSEDGAGFLDGTNLYVYVNNRSVVLVDASGLLSQTTNGGPNCGKCGAYDWDISWVLDATEQPAGFIFQRVELTQEAKDCGGKKDVAFKSIDPAIGCTNTKRCSGPYVELWEIDANGVFKPGNADRFSHTEPVDAESKGKIHQTGVAQYFHVPVNPNGAQLSLLKFINEAFPDGGGVINACSLRSACLSDLTDTKKWGNKWNSLKTALSNAVTKKEATRVWNCCPCQTDTDTLTCSFGSPEGSIVQPLQTACN